MSVRVERAQREFSKLHQDFQEHRLIDERFYDELERHGCHSDGCVLIDVFPDGDETYCGRIIRQDGRVFAFDLDLSDPTQADWREITSDFVAELRQGKHAQPWAREKLASQMFEILGGQLQRLTP